MLEASKINTLMTPKPIELFDDNDHVDPTEYLSFTRPDITYAINLVPTFSNSNQNGSSHNQTNFVLHKRNLTHGLRYLSQSSLTINAFCDADWARCPATR